MLELKSLLTEEQRATAHEIFEVPERFADVADIMVHEVEWQVILLMGKRSVPDEELRQLIEKNRLSNIPYLLIRDMFSRAVSASGSMWFPDFAEYTEKNQFCRRPDKVYFSLGDKEARTRNQLLSTVEDKTREIYGQYKDSDIDTVFEMNPGNHFKDADIRLAKGIAWILE